MNIRLPKLFYIYIIVAIITGVIYSEAVIRFKKENSIDAMPQTAIEIAPEGCFDEEASELVSAEIPENEPDDNIEPQYITVNRAAEEIRSFYCTAVGCAEEDFLWYPDVSALGDGLREITRSEFAELFVKLCEDLKNSGSSGHLGIDAYINDIVYIPDVTEEIPHADSIFKLYNMGIVSGNGDAGHFEPDSFLSKKQAEIMLARMAVPSLRIKFEIPGNLKSAELEVDAILQNPELPSGCEITSLAMVLNYLGFDADKCDLADNYLDKGAVGETSYYVAFIGNPREWGLHGCFAPVIVRAAQKYLDEKESSLVAYNTSGTRLDALFTEIDAGHPVIIWGTMSMMKSYESAVWIIDGERVPWIANEHCMVLYGYDRDRNVVKIADPLKGNVEYDMDLFETRFKELFMQSVIIK